MNGKKFVMPILLLVALMLMVSPAFAAITVTWGTPASGTIFSNNPSNRQTIDVNFAFTDSNTDAGNDMNYQLYLRQDGSSWAFRTITSDTNIYDANLNKTSLKQCFVKTATDGTGSCNIVWTMPLNTEMPDGYYCLDVNVREMRNLGGATPDTYSTDKNALVCFTVDTGFAAAAATRAMLLPTAVVLAAALLVSIILAITVLGTDPMKTLVAGGIAGISLAVILMLFGTIVGLI